MLVSTLREFAKRSLSPASAARVKNVLQLDRRESFSQYGEDAVLFAYFCEKEWTPQTVGRARVRRKGFYVDIGAYAPTQLSNTHLFYRSGWRGINVDPTPGVMDGFEKVRSRDINLQLAIGGEVGELEFFSWGSPCVFNTLSADVAAERTPELGPPTKILVPCLTLSQLLSTYLPAGQGIDFLSVDVEGMDLSVLQSNDWDMFRPEILLVESYVYDLESIADDPIHRFALDHDYQLHAWVPPTLIYKSRTGLRSPQP